MKTLRLLPSSAFALVSVTMLALPSGASADVYVFRPRHVVVAPPPPVYVAPAPVYVAPAPVYVAPAPAAPGCVTRTVRIWANGSYTYRAVRTCY